MHKHSQTLTFPGFFFALWITVCIGVALPAAASPTTPLPPTTPLQLGWDWPLEYLKDAEGTLTPQQVQKLPAEAFTPQHRPLSLGYSPTTVWLRLTVPEPLRQEPVLWLLLEPTHLDSLIAYQPRASDGSWQAQHGGDLVPAPQRPPVRLHLFRVDPGQPLLLRMQSNTALKLGGHLARPPELLQLIAASERTQGLYFGAMAVMVLALWGAAAMVRTRQLLALCVLGTVALAHTFTTRGYGSLWAPPDLTAWASHSVGITAFAIAAAASWQAREQLTQGTAWRRLDAILLALTAINLAGMVSMPLGFYGSVVWINLLTLFATSSIATLVCCVNVRRHGWNPPRALLLFTYATHALFGLPIAAAMAGLYGSRWDIPTVWQLQVLVFTTLVAAAILTEMFFRYRAAQRLKDDALSGLAASESLLEQRIHQRTQELSDAHLALEGVLASERALRLEQRQFFNMISHEFRTPLAVVDSAATEQMSFPSPDLAAQQERAAQIRRACRRLSSLVDNCLINERFESAGFRLVPAPVPISELVQDAAQLVQWSRRHTLRLLLDPAVATWVCDATLVRIALSNLVDNAIKYAHAGEILVSATKTERGLMRLAVSDEGPGLSLEAVHRIFEQFERGHRTDQTRGFGLGLWVTRRIAREHGGDVNVEALADQGTCFSITLAPQRVYTPDSQADPGRRPVPGPSWNALPTAPVPAHHRPAPPAARDALHESSGK